MEASQYQELASRTRVRGEIKLTGEETMIVFNAVGLAGEAGEVAEHVKKGIFHGHGIDREKLKKELGDVLWYIAELCSVADLDMGDVMGANIAKLKERYPEGFSTAASIARVDTSPGTA